MKSESQVLVLDSIRSQRKDGMPANPCSLFLLEISKNQEYKYGFELLLWPEKTDDLTSFYWHRNQVKQLIHNIGSKVC